MPVPIIHANGIDDDSQGLQALFNGKPFHVLPIPDNEFYANYGEGEILLKGGRFIINKRLILRHRKPVTISGCSFTNTLSDKLPSHSRKHNDGDASLNHAGH